VRGKKFNCRIKDELKEAMLEAGGCLRKAVNDQSADTHPYHGILLLAPAKDC
jgi:hypothetical protein